MTLSVVIPARNEAQNIGATLDALRERLARAAIPYELLVVDDGSTDTTGQEVLARRAIDPGVRLERNDGAHGFGRAVRYGLERFTGEAVVICMADGSDRPDDLVPTITSSSVKPSAPSVRDSSGGATRDYPPLKLFVNRLANGFVRLLFGLRYNDVTNAFKGYRAEVIHGCQPLISPHFNLTVELPLKAIVRGYTYKIVPIWWSNRKVGT